MSKLEIIPDKNGSKKSDNIFIASLILYPRPLFSKIICANAIGVPPK